MDPQYDPDELAMPHLDFQSWTTRFQDSGRWGQEPEVGALMFFHFDTGRVCHAEWVEQILADGQLRTISFNTSPADPCYKNSNMGCFSRDRSATWGVEGYGYPYPQVYTPSTTTDVAVAS